MMAVAQKVAAQEIVVPDPRADGAPLPLEEQLEQTAAQLAPRGPTAGPKKARAKSGAAGVDGASSAQGG